MNVNMAIPAKRFRVRLIVGRATVFERVFMMAFEATGLAAFHATPDVTLENLLSEFRPPALVQAGVVAAPRMLATHRTIAVRSGRRGRVFFARR